MSIGDGIPITPERLLDAIDPPHGLEAELRKLLNRHGAEGSSNTPDHLLARYLIACLTTYNEIVVQRALWYRRWDEPGRGSAEILTAPF